VETYAAMAKRPAYVEKIAGPKLEIENVKRRGKIDPKKPGLLPRSTKPTVNVAILELAPFVGREPDKVFERLLIEGLNKPRRKVRTARHLRCFLRKCRLPY
jgi:hypothetical protein